MRALVTGSAGFVGRHFAAELEARGLVVSGCDLVTGWDALDIFRQDITRDRIQHYELVVHAAAQAPHRAAIDGQPGSHIYNQLLDAAMFAWAVRTGQGRVLYLSSCAALDQEPDDYGRLKLTGERLAAQARAAGVPVTVVRPFSGYGEDQSENFPFGAFAGRARRREDPFPLWNATAVRDWIHIDDVVAGAVAVAESGTEQAVSLCTGVATDCQTVAAMMCEAAGYLPRFDPQGDKPAGVAHRVGDPSVLLRYYAPQVTLGEGVKRATVGGNR